MNVAYFGTSDRSIPILNALKNSFNLVLVVTKCDTFVGRHREVRQTEVKKWGLKNNVGVLEIDNFKADNAQKVIEQLIDSKVNYILVADFSFIIPEILLDKFNNRVINVHFSLLPKYRGASPVQFAIMNGEKTSGITFYLVDKYMDRGKILTQFEYNLPDNATSGDMWVKLFEYAAEKVTEVLNDYSSSKLLPQEQNESLATYTYSKTHPKATFIFKEDAQIDWEENPQIIEMKIRAFNPWPVAWTYLGDLENNFDKVVVNGGEIRLSLRKSSDRGLKTKIYSAKIQDGKLKIESIQVEGKNVMTWKDFLNGFTAENKD